MAMSEKPQIYLVTPPTFEPADFRVRLEAVLDAHPVACLRLDLATRDEDRLSRAADALRQITEPRDIALVVRDHVVLAQRLGLDGVHLSDAARSVRQARKALDEDAIVGAFCGRSRHAGMTAGEAGADYICFGPVQSSGLDDGAFAEAELFAWWSEVIELPVVAEGGFDAAHVSALGPVADFLAFGEEIWTADDPAEQLGHLLAPLQ